MCLALKIVSRKRAFEVQIQRLFFLFSTGKLISACKFLRCSDPSKRDDSIENSGTRLESGRTFFGLREGHVESDLCGGGFSINLSSGEGNDRNRKELKKYRRKTWHLKAPVPFQKLVCKACGVEIWGIKITGIPITLHATRCSVVSIVTSCSLLARVLRSAENGVRPVRFQKLGSPVLEDWSPSTYTVAVFVPVLLLFLCF